MNRYDKEIQAALLNESQESTFSAHLTLRWTNFYDPTQENLKKALTYLDVASQNIRRVLDEDFSTPPSRPESL